MSLFRRGRRADASEDPGSDEPAAGAHPGADGTEREDAGVAPTTAGPGADRSRGPWDLSEVDDPAAGGRVDLGGMWLPGRPGLEVRVEADQATSRVVAVTLVLGDGALQVQPFAAPRSEGIWDEVRAEIRAGITAQGGVADEVEGPLGVELRTKVPVRAADGSSGVQPARFVGVDGPRWFLRGVLTGRAAVGDGADTELIDLLRDVVVVRGDQPMAPRDPIPLELPAATAPAGAAGGDEHQPEDEPAGGGADSDLRPFERGPEITEIR